MSEEKVLVLPPAEIAETLFHPTLTQKRLTVAGLQSVDTRALYAAIRNRGEFVERSLAEQDPTLKQIIPYCVIKRGSDIFTFIRKDKSGEKRLRGMLSLGVGGHVNPVEGMSPDVACKLSLFRELYEEVSLAGETHIKVSFISIINDDRDEVGKVHLGLFHIIDTDADVSTNEPDVLEGRFVPIETIEKEYKDRLEGWSSLVFERLRGLGKLIY